MERTWKLTAREIIGSGLASCDSLVDSYVAAVHGAEDGILETAWILWIQVELAVFARLGDGDARADGGDVGVED